MLSRTAVIETINGLPERFSIEEAIDKLVLLQKIEVGISQSAKGETISTEEAKEKLKKWLR